MLTFQQDVEKPMQGKTWKIVSLSKRSRAVKAGVLFDVSEGVNSTKQIVKRTTQVSCVQGLRVTTQEVELPRVHPSAIMQTRRRCDNNTWRHAHIKANRQNSARRLPRELFLTEHPPPFVLSALYCSPAPPQNNTHYTWTLASSIAG